MTGLYYTNSKQFLCINLNGSLLLEDNLVNDSWFFLGNANNLGYFRRDSYLCGKKDE
jgi:hypothetical protein